MTVHRIIVIGASEGGVSALRALFEALPERLPAAVFVALHIGAHPSDLPAILNHDGKLPAIHPKDGEAIQAGRVYVAPPDHHMIIADRRVLRLTKGPRENFARPSIDPLFRSAAEIFGSAVIGVILTGGLNDGTAGLYEIKRRGGIVVVQDPDDAINPSMPRSALQHVQVDHCAPLALIPRLLSKIVASHHIGGEDVPSGVEAEQLSSKRGGRDMTAEYTLDHPVAVTCPDCGGALRQTMLGTLKQFRCHIGHVYTGEAMLDGQFRTMEQSIEAALRSLNERAELCREMAERPGIEPSAAKLWREAVEEAQERSRTLRGLLELPWLQPPILLKPAA